MRIRSLSFAGIVFLGAVCLLLSPDGSQAGFPGVNGKIAFAMAGDIYVMNADGSAQTRLTNDPGLDISPTWSPDGSKIAFVSDRTGESNIYVMNADGTDPINISSNTEGDFQPSWSPDGLRIAFESGADIYAMSTDGSGRVNLSNHPAYDGSPAWSPNGNRIAFMSDRDGNFEIYVMHVSGSLAARLTDRPGFNFFPDWSPDGSKIAFFANGPLYVMNADGSGQTVLTSDGIINTTPGWSPDGRQIAFASNRSGSPGVHIMDADGSNVTRLADGGEPDWQPLPPKRGDANCSGSINALDALVDLRQVAGQRANACVALAGNIKCDDGLTTTDPLLILQFVAGLPVILPPGCPEIGS